MASKTCAVASPRILADCVMSVGSSTNPQYLFPFPFFIIWIFLKLFKASWVALAGTINSSNCLLFGYNFEQTDIILSNDRSISVKDIWSCCWHRKQWTLTEKICKNENRKMHRAKKGYRGKFRKSMGPAKRFPRFYSIGRKGDGFNYTSGNFRRPAGVCCSWRGEREKRKKEM